MNTRLCKLETYKVRDLTGISRRCDWFIHDHQLLNITNTLTPNTIFISAYRGYNAFPYFYNKLFPDLTTPFVLIIASEDYTFPTGKLDLRANFYHSMQKEIATLLSSPLLIHCFVENLDTLLPKISPLPLGILHYENRDLYTPLLYSPHPISMDKRGIRVLSCHRDNRDGPQWDIRKRVATYCKNGWSKFVTYETNLKPTDFRDRLLNTQFCLCVHGGGVDPSPRAWEALLCGAIPILEHSTLDEAYSRFPVAYIDAWTPDAITPAKLDKWLTELRQYYEHPDKRSAVLSMLTTDYWWDIITQKVNVQGQCESPA